MDNLIARADAIRPVAKRRKLDNDSSHKKPKPSGGEDRTLHSIVPHTSLPKSLRTSSPPPEGSKSFNHIPNPKLRQKLTRESAQAAKAKALVKDAELLLQEDAGGIQLEDEMERTWRVGQDEVVKASGQEAARGRREWTLDGGPYRSRYTRNGRHLAVVGNKGHVATFDWQTGTLHSELQLQETCRDIT